jgi:hypothetical protein
MGINEAGKESDVSQINNLGTGRQIPRADRADAVLFYQDYDVGDHRSCGHIEHPGCPHDHRFLPGQRVGHA